MDCIACKEPIEDPVRAIEWHDRMLKDGQKVPDVYWIHIVCYNMKSYKGLHQNLKPGKYE